MQSYIVIYGIKDFGEGDKYPNDKSNISDGFGSCIH